MQSTDNPKKLPVAFASSGTKRDIPVPSQQGTANPGAASFMDGFPPLTFTPLEVGGIPPSGSDFNGILYLLSNAVRWMNGGGGFHFDLEFCTSINGYPKGARLLTADNTDVWVNLNENNTTDPDGATPIGWAALSSLKNPIPFAQNASGFNAGTPIDGTFARFAATEAIAAHAHYGFLDNSTVTYTGAGFQGHASFNDNVKHTGSQNSDHHHSFQAYPHYNNTGTVGRLSCFWALPDITAGTVTELSQFKASNPSGNGSIGTLYGLYIEALTRGSTNWSIYSPGTAPSFHGGKLRMGQLANPMEFGYNPNTGNTEIIPRTGYHVAVKSGALLIGTDAQLSGEAMNATATVADYSARIYNNHATAPRGLAIVYPNVAPNSTASEFLRCQDSQNIKLMIQSNGNVVNQNNSYGAISDAKLKTDIVDATPKLADVMKLRLVNYKKKSDPSSKDIGFIAQEVEKVFPGLVYETKDVDGAGNDLGTVTKGVKYSILTPILVKALQESQATQDVLRGEFDALKAEFQAYKAAHK